MDLKELKRQLNEAGFSSEVLAKLNELIDQAMVGGGLDAVAKQQMMDLIDIDVEAGVLEADTMENMSLTLGSLADETEKAVQMADEADARVEADVNEKVEKVEDAVKMKQVRQQIPAAPTTDLSKSMHAAETCSTLKGVSSPLLSVAR